MKWHYQVMRKTWEQYPDEIEFDVYEFYENEAGEPKQLNWTKEPVGPNGNTMQELLQSLENMKADIIKHGIRDYNTGELINEEKPQ